MNLVRMALPWIAFAALSAFSWPAAAVAGLLLSIGVVTHRRRSGSPWEDLILETAALVFFVLVGAFAFASPHSFLRPYSGAGSQGWLALAAWFSIAVGKPFTMAFAKRSTPPEIWKEPRFLKVNTTITSFWAASFTVFSALIAITYAVTGNSGAAGLVQLIGLAIPGVFTVRYAARARARGAAAAA
jgi:hypothetical protein